MPELEGGVKSLVATLYPALGDDLSLESLISQVPGLAPEGVVLRRLADGEWIVDGGDGRSRRQGRGKDPAEAVAAWLIAMAARRL